MSSHPEEQRERAPDTGGSWRESHHQYGKVDLNNCDREPIHVPGAIQPHGALLALHEPELEVAVASENARALLGVDGPLIGRSAAQIFGEHGVAAIRQMSIFPRSTVGPARLSANGQSWDGILHRSEGLLVLELEPSSEAPPEGFLDFYRRVRFAVTRLQQGARTVEMCRVAANEVRSLTGFDRVMIYRFAPDQSGEVIAEARAPALESFLGLHYPAADIPPQARELYRANWLRLIADIEYMPSALQPVDHPLTGRPLDLTYSVLRSVSPIHREYLRNMGVRASMSISLITSGELWGLIACHHYAPMFVSYEIRSSSEFLGQVLSWQLEARSRAEMSERMSRAKDLQVRLTGQISIHESLGAALCRDEDALLALTDSSGAAVVGGDEVHTAGEVPSNDRLRRIADAVRHVMDDDGMFGTHQIGELIPDWEGPFRGVLAARLDDQDQELVLWLRQERRATVTWGHDGAHAGSHAREADRLSPLGSFRTWQEIVRGQSKPWSPADRAVAVELRAVLATAAVRRARELSRINAELASAAEEKDAFLATLSHELRSPMQAIVGWSQMLATAGLSEDRRRHAIEVLRRNAQLQTQLIDDLLDVSRLISGKLRLETCACDLAQVVQDSVDTVSTAADARSIGIQMQLDSRAVEVQADPNRMQQVIWNLLSNAIKFTPKGGKVQVRLEQVHSSARISVTDNGEGIDSKLLPHIFDRFRQGEGGGRGGLGLGLSIVRGLVELHGGTVAAHSDGLGAGSCFEIVLPLASIREAGREEAPSSIRARDVGDDIDLSGIRVLLVDDDEDATDLLGEALRVNGADVICVNSGRDALSCLRTERVDVLISDIGMPEMNGYELVRAIRQNESTADLPAIALTAYGQAQDRARAYLAGFQTHLSKPIEPLELRSVVSSLASRRANRGDP